MNNKIIRGYWMGSLFIILLSMIFQNIILFRVGSIAVRLFHVTSILLIPAFFPVRKFILPPWPLIVFGVTVLLASVIAAPVMGISSTFLSWILGFYVIIAVLNLPNDVIGYIPRLIIFSVGVFILWIIIKLIVFREVILTFPFTQKNIFHPAIPCAFVGGNNIEASWLALLGVFMYKHYKSAALYMSVAFLYSIVSASRAGLLACCMIFVWLLIRNKKRFKILALTIVMVGIGYFAYYNLPTGFNNPVAEVGENDAVSAATEISERSETLTGSPLFTSETGSPYESRLATIGTDPGSRGRLKMWKKIPDAIAARPQGYGLGNSTKALNRFLEEDEAPISEDNVHNLFFEFLIVGGFLSFFMFVGLVLYFAIVNLKDYCARNPYAAFVGAYLLLGLIQFKGTDMIMFFGLAMWIKTFYEKIRKKKTANEF